MRKTKVCHGSERASETGHYARALLPAAAACGRRNRPAGRRTRGSHL